ncbi:tetratricopeptide repeat protein [Rhizobium binae]|uniref:Flp pilus assembly protein TadD n=1 Tax=Rhizobium binae TaxID=1138190 RepID=A0ABV2MFS5_9HYPH|nr:tetratricopeptide repeat protein [Rhizobium binae]NKL49872.1 tetratricopeptide repeat protein [Rhizobium leguminosarum bv. viciae]MBX4924309.1 tetratricopeptide repeat protein [Rhizobium binae]MBX4935991.1 tetratricopeptide repeat protein [Rhizobium binae]MBX4942030.1 tetratricopeptide repeat protein [Rhizobium binae]MBX4950540.1 tetratricopeptide repeat protein [Rhizobium binae]
MLQIRAGTKCIAILIAAGAILAGCQSSSDGLAAYGDSAKTLEDDSAVAFYKNDELITNGKLQFQEKNYGKSYAIYKRAVDVFPQDPAAWLGLAASADMVARFDTSDRAYQQLARMIGNTPVYYNNIGYSHLLRGDLRTARRYFLKAYELDPGNEVTARNLELMKNSVNYAQR